jgi:hypothetical protein
MHKGSLVHAGNYNGSDVYDPLQAHVYRQDESKGIMENPLYAPKICFHYGNVQFENSTHSSFDP